MTTLINRDELARAIETGAVTVVDTLPSSYYDQQHLPNAVNLVEDEVADRAATLLADKATAVVTYCSNPACGNSSAVARRLEQLGYTNVRRYKGGIQDWVEAEMPTQTSQTTTGNA
ncbi:MAG: rhodanese-like domain-containing protein [Actinomycetota bacterium]|nr:rhodanese-like domain-containing protein [Actinomycetota bacterium]MDQ6949375.1 rhodanese-like domain-containing protein [Actinomycetota bacterium]